MITITRFVKYEIINISKPACKEVRGTVYTHWKATSQVVVYQTVRHFIYNTLIYFIPIISVFVLSTSSLTGS